jgi:hypothetical protein
MNARVFPGLILISAILLLLPIVSLAQPDRDPSEKKELIYSHKIAFITDKLALTPQEAQAFWPVYNEYEDKRETLQKDMFKDSGLDDINVDALTDEEATRIADDQIIKAQKLLDLRKEYHSKFKGILPPKKVLMLYHAEREFQHELLKKIRSEHEPGPPPRRY